LSSIVPAWLWSDFQFIKYEMKESARTPEKTMKVDPKKIRGFDKILPFSGDSVCGFCVFFSIMSIPANLVFF